MEILKQAMKMMGITCSEKDLEKFQKFMELVLEWNEKVNLTAIVDREDFQIKHFADSLMAAKFSGFIGGERVIDVGTGGGFPGIPLAICFPEKEFLLTDSLNKRILILDEIIEKLKIDNVITLHSRAEDLAKSKVHREKYDICLSRAVAKLSVLSEYCLPFVKEGGYFGAYKAGDTKSELNDAKFALELLGGSLYKETDFLLKEYHLDHKILWFKKEKKTPKRFPRKAGTPSKEPLMRV